MLSEEPVDRPRIAAEQIEELWKLCQEAPLDVTCHLGKRSPRFAPLRPRTSGRWCFARTASRETLMNFAKSLAESISPPASICAARFTPLSRASASEDPTSFAEAPTLKFPYFVPRDSLIVLANRFFIRCKIASFDRRIRFSF